ncbi:MAG: pilus assembly protein, partial [Chloroflexi bacterium]
MQWHDHHGDSLMGRLSRRDRSAGQTLMEFALVIPMVVLLLLAVFDMGRGVYGLSAVGNAAR